MKTISFSNVSRASHRGSDEKPNEDGLLSLPGIEGVFDGATPLGPARISSRTSDAEWFVNAMTTTMGSLFASASEPLALIESSLRRVSQEYVTLLANNRVDASRMAPYEKPCSSMAIVSTGEKGVFAHGIGDCDLLVRKHQTGQVVQVFSQHPVHQKLDNHAAKKYTEARQQGMSHQEARAEIHDLLISNRILANAPDGYPVLTPHIGCLKNISSVNLSETLGVEPGDSILLCSDGFAPLYGTYQAFSRGEMFENNVNSLIERLRDIERSDPDITKHPRLKPSDDATVTVITLS